jgi:tape measure domain-containing protein
METIVIDITAKYNDQTSKNLNESTKAADRFNDSIKNTKKQANLADKSLDKMYSTVKYLAKQAIKIPVKILDYATAPLRGILGFATSLKGILTGIVAGVVMQKAIMAPLNYADSISGALVGFETKLGSIEKAQKMMKEIEEFAIRTPFETQGLVSTSQRMLAMGWAVEKILPDLEKIGNAAAGTGKGEEGIQRITLALSQMRMKGKISAEEMLQLTEAGVNGWKYLADGMGVTIPQIQKMTSKGLVPVEKAIDAIIAGMGEFDGLMESTATRTVSGLMSQIKDTFAVTLVKKWGEGLQVGAIKGMGKLNELLSNGRGTLDKLGDKLKDLGTGLSTWVVDKFDAAYRGLLGIMKTREFQEADLFGKVKIVWRDMIVTPFDEWWSSEGLAWAAGLGEKIGHGIGTFNKGVIMTLLGVDLDGITNSGISVGQSFATGFLEGFDASTVGAAIWEAIKGGYSNAGKVITNEDGTSAGEKVGGIATIAGTVMVLKKLGLLGKLGTAAAAGIGSIGAAAGLGGAGAAGLGAATIGTGGTALIALGLAAAATMVLKPIVESVSDLLSGKDSDASVTNKSSTSKQENNITLGNMYFEVKTQDGESVVSSIRRELPSVTDMLANELATRAAEIFNNTPRKSGATEW